jgi:hypothetical protein
VREVFVAAEGLGASGLIVARVGTALPFSHGRNRRHFDGRALEPPLTRNWLEATQIIPTAILAGRRMAPE